VSRWKGDLPSAGASFGGRPVPTLALSVLQRSYAWLMDRDYVDWVGREDELRAALGKAWRPGVTGRELVQAVRSPRSRAEAGVA
jgi:hypothetical protein